MFVLKRARNQGRESDLFASLELTSDPVLELEFHLHDDDDDDDDDDYDDSDDSDDDDDDGKNGFVQLNIQRGDTKAA